jgi:hypothetical protein
MFFRFKNIEEVPKSRGWEAAPISRWLQWNIAPYIFGCIYGFGSCIIVVCVAWGPRKSADGQERVIKMWLYTAISFGLFGTAALYYFLFLFNEKTSLARVAAIKVRKFQHGDECGNSDEQTLIRRCDVCKDGSGTHRHTRDGYKDYYEVLLPENNIQGSTLYWFFGGSHERHHPHAVRHVDSIKAGFMEFPERLKRKLIHVFSRGSRSDP